MTKKTKIRILNTVLIAAAAGLIIAVTGYLRQGLTDAAAAERYDDTRREVVDIRTHEVNFSAIRDAGSPSTAWLYIPDTPVDYPLVQGPDNDTYLDMDAYGHPSKAGAIFINFANSLDLSDAKTVIFGHNMSDGSMFTVLHSYADEDWGSRHRDAYIYMDDGTVRHYRLLYYLFTEPLNEEVYVVSKAENADTAAAGIEGIADIVYGQHNGGNLICLSTCTYHTFRTVVVFEYLEDAPPVDGHSFDPESLPGAGKGAAAGDGVTTPESVPLEDFNTEDGGEPDAERDVPSGDRTTERVVIINSGDAEEGGPEEERTAGDP